ncbi:sugar ABC transporter substrate-binding protein [Actinomyces wuliandei]|uniref:sugar ABC transporter substrate-binding protein n=1 Tax=Actinomyces wuliandei TaxID=2057743 RepID=UPI00214CA341|nr:extracellular solute-binding protein [Actinomyces wuliandei]
MIWADEPKARSVEDAARAWGEEQGITVAVQVIADDQQDTFITANQAGNGPDIMLGAHDWIGNLVQNGTITPVTISEEDRTNISEVALSAVTYDAQTYAVPYAVETLGLFVNKSLTDVVAPGSLEELVEAGRAADTGTILSLPVGEEGNAYHFQPIYTAGGGYLFGRNEDGSYNPDDLGVGKEGSLQAAERISELGSDGVLKKSVTDDNYISLFTEGKAPYLVSGPWALADIKAAGIDYQLSEIPGFTDVPDSQALPFAGVNCFYVASKGRNRAFAESLVTHVATSSSFVEKMFALNELPPVHKDLADRLSADNPDMVSFSELAAQTDPMPSIPEMSAVWMPLAAAQANIVAGADPESTMTSAGDQIASSLAG